MVLKRPKSLEEIGVPVPGQTTARCRKCGATLTTAFDARRRICADCVAGVDASAREVVLTTAEGFEGFTTVQTIEIVGAECIAGVGPWRDLLAHLTDAFGGRSGALQKSLRESRATCLAELRVAAADVGANAVIGVRLNYSEISGQGTLMLLVAATGTAVRLEPR